MNRVSRLARQVVRHKEVELNGEVPYQGEIRRQELSSVVQAVQWKEVSDESQSVIFQFDYVANRITTKTITQKKRLVSKMH